MSESFAEAMDSAMRYADMQPFVPLGVGMMLKPMLDRLQAAHDEELEKAHERAAGERPVSLRARQVGRKAACGSQVGRGGRHAE